MDQKSHKSNVGTLKLKIVSKRKFSCYFNKIDIGNILAFIFKL